MYRTIDINDGLIDDESRSFITKKRLYIKRKAQRTVLKKQAEHSILNKTIPPRVSKILTEHPSIGKDIIS